MERDHRRVRDGLHAGAEAARHGDPERISGRGPLRTAAAYPHNNDYRNVVGCSGGLNMYHPPVADPTTGIMYASHRRGCRAPSFLVPTNGEDEERGLPGLSAVSWRGRERHTSTTGTTVAAWAPGGRRAFLPLIEGLPVYKPLYQGLAPTT